MVYSFFVLLIKKTNEFQWYFIDSLNRQDDSLTLSLLFLMKFKVKYFAIFLQIFYNINKFWIDITNKCCLINK